MRRSIVFVVALLAALAVSVPATAGGARVTRGDAEAILQARITGGLAIEEHAPVIHGAADQLAGWINPLRDEQHFCEEDWHAVRLAIFAGGDRSYTHADAVAVLSPVDVGFEIDGNALMAVRTSIKRLTFVPAVFELEEAYGFTTGVVLAPGDVTVGSHTLTTFVDFSDVGVVDTFSVTFTIDPAGTGACL